MSYGMIGILLISRYAAPPYPAAPDFLHGKACHTILRSLCSLTNRVPLPPHPGDRINRSMLSCGDMAPGLSIHSAPRLRGKGSGASHQRGNAFPRPQGGCMVFAAKGGIKNGAEGAVPPQWNGTSYLPRAEARSPSGRRQPVPDRTLAAQGQRPGGWLNPHARKGVSTFGNTGKHRPGPDPDRAEGA